MSNKLKRRAFIARAAGGLGSTLAMLHLPDLLRGEATRKNIPLGFQSWTLKDKLSKDFTGTLKTMSGMGYHEVEMCSPPGYATIGFGPLVKIKASDMRSMIIDAGLSCTSSHFGFPELTDNLDDRIEWSHQMGLTQMICSTFWLPKASTLKDYQEAADKLNKAGEKIKAAGMQTGFHNHDFEFAKLENQLIYDVLMSHFDPNLVKMQFQTEVINLGYKASTYFQKYPGRFISSHLSDWTANKKEAPIGQGIIDWKEFFDAAVTGGVKNFFVEMNFDKFRDSAVYINQL